MPQSTRWYSSSAPARISTAVAWAATLLCASAAAGQAPAAAASGAMPGDSALLGFMKFRSIGPAGPGGRVDDIAVSRSNPDVEYIAFATGGLFRSTNRGVTFEPVFEADGSASFGDVAIDPRNADVVYAGTGENNNRQSSSFGDGLYKTMDGGKSWTYVGLRETQTISRIVIDPEHPDVVYVAADGHLFGPNPERGIYKSGDGGRTWRRVAYVDENTGFTDLALDPSNPRTLYAASYERRRSGCCYNGGGPGSGMWKSTDGGEHWKRLAGHGLPGGTYGRIALSVAPSEPRVVYAQIEASPLAASGAAPAGGEEEGGGGRGGYDWCNNGAPPAAGSGGRGGARPALDESRGGVYRSADRGATWVLVSNCDNRPLYFSQIVADPRDANTVYVAGPATSVSRDGGRTFTELSRAGGVAEPSHVDIHAIWIDPSDSRHLMLGTDGGVNVTWDGGHAWAPITTMSTGLAYWVSADMRRPYRVVTGMQDNGVWGGPSATRAAEGVILNASWYGINPGDGFHTAVDPSDYHIVYAESQNGAAIRYDLATGDQQSIRPAAPPRRGGPAPAGAVGSCVDGRIVAGGGRGRGFGAGSSAGNVVNAAPGEQYRFNWNTPFILSPDDPNIVWFGGNRLFKSYDRGSTYVESPDLTKAVDRCRIDLMGASGAAPQLGKNDGVTFYSTIISISESPVAPGDVWAGTDDGNLEVSRDGGTTFTEVGHAIPGLPAGALTGDNPYWISSIDASHTDPATAYVSVDGHRSDDMHPYVFVTHDYGSTFQSVAGDLPVFGNVQVIREDPRNPALLYVGTELGLYLSADTGRTWQKAPGGFPTVRTDDILIHPRDGDLIVATHGRGVWIADDITPLQQLTPAEQAQPAALLDVRDAVAYRHDVEADQCRPTLPCLGQALFVGENAPRGTAIDYYLRDAAAGPVHVAVTDASGRVLCTSDGSGAPGVHRIQWTLAVPPEAGAAGRGGGRGGRGGEASMACNRDGTGPTAGPGTYAVTLSIGDQHYSKPVRVLEDRWLNER